MRIPLTTAVAMGSSFEEWFAFSGGRGPSPRLTDRFLPWAAENTHGHTSCGQDGDHGQRGGQRQGRSQAADNCGADRTAPVDQEREQALRGVTVLVGHQPRYQAEQD